MKRSWLTLTAGVVLALVAYFGFYFISTARYRALENGPEPELAWLQKEFHVDRGELARICEMHQAYLSGCAERCHLIDQKQEQLRRLLNSTNRVTPEIEKMLAETAQLRAECQKKMLQHFYEISQTMPPDQGRRYLTWIQERTVLSASHSQMHH